MKKTIAFVSSVHETVLGGGEKWNINTGKMLKEKGYRILLISRNNSKISSEFKPFADMIIPFKFGFDFNPVSVSNARKILQQNNIDTVICNFNKDISIFGIAAHSINKRVIFRNGFPLIKKKWKHKLLLNYFDLILTNSNDIKDQYASYNWDLEKKTIVLYNSFLKPDIDIKNELSRKNVYKIFGAGRLTSVKNFDLFIKSIETCTKHGLPVEGYIAGNGPEKEKLEKLSRDRGIKINFLGHIDNIYAQLSEMDIFLHCSKNEGMPNVIIEAMYCGLPVVASNAGATPELIEHGKHGFIVNNPDTEEYAGYIKQILNDPENSREIIVHAREQILNNFEPDKIISTLENML